MFLDASPRPFSSRTADVGDGEDDDGPPSVVPLHTAVAGRARFGVDGLRGAPAVARRIERRLARVEIIEAVSANPRTGNVLVRYDVAAPLGGVIGHLEAVLRSGPDSAADDDEDDDDQPDWHALDASQVEAALGTSLSHGLSSAEARRRLEADGANLTPAPEQRSDAGILLAQFRSLPVGLLAGAAVVSAVTGGLIEAVAIMAVVGANGLIGFRTERTAERTIRSLGAPPPMTAQVSRDGRLGEAPAETLVVGDLLHLQRGMVAAADARLVSAHSLTLSEAALTGESLPVRKSVEPLSGERVALGDRRNMIYRGTIVTGGRGTAVVVATGARTEVGRIQSMVNGTAAPVTPIERQLGVLGEQLVWLALAASGAIFGVGWLRGIGLLQLVRSTLSVAVAAVPEGLPMVATTTLAMGVTEMRRLGVHVRRLGAVETLASVDVICFDKTGTLTANSMSVEAVALGRRTFRAAGGALRARDGADARGEEERRLRQMLSVASLCSETEIDDSAGAMALSGSGTENALVQAAFDNGIDVQALRDARPRRSIQERTEAFRFMATAHAADGRLFLAVKGSPGEVLGRCVREMQADGETRLLTPDRRSEIEQCNAGLAREGLRVLGVAFRETGADDGRAPEVESLTWVGLAGLADPVRPGLAPLMGTLHRAGIRTIMLTGDQRATAQAIGAQIGLAGADEMEIIDAAEVDRMSVAALAGAARRVHAFARVSPGQKLKIVQGLQRAGAVVAMIGDGVNDAPALRAADVGFAMGQDATGAAQDVADVYLANDDLGSLVAAIERGRTTYANIHKAIYYLVGSNASEILLMLAATAMGACEPLSAVQLLWINLMSDVLPAIGLAMEPPEPDQMRRPPRPRGEAVINRADAPGLALDAGLLTAGALASGLYAAARGGLNAPQVRTNIFASLVTGQLLHAIACRSSKAGPLGRVGANRALTRIVAGSLAIQAAGLAFPSTRRLLGSTAIGPGDGLAILAGGVLPFLVREIGRRGRKAGAGLPVQAAQAPFGATVTPLRAAGPAPRP